MSGRTVALLLNTTGWVVLTAGVAVYSPAAAAIIGGSLLMIYGTFAVDIARPGRRQRKNKHQRDPHTLQTTNGNIRVTNPR